MAVDIAAPAKWLADKLKLYPLKQLAVAASVWLPIGVALEWGIAALGWDRIVAEVAFGYGGVVTATGLSLLFGLVSTWLSVKLIRSSRRKARQRLREASAEAKRQASQDLFRRRSDSISHLSPQAVEVLKWCVENRRSTYEFRDGSPGERASREIADCRWAHYHEPQYGDSWISIMGPQFNFLLENPRCVGSTASPISTADNLEFDG